MTLADTKFRIAPAPTACTSHERNPVPSSVWFRLISTWRQTSFDPKADAFTSDPAIAPVTECEVSAKISCASASKSTSHIGQTFLSYFLSPEQTNDLLLCTDCVFFLNLWVRNGKRKRKKTQLFVGFRKTNGQIGYLSESLSIPEFFELVQPSHNSERVLVDFAPVIETLHSLHNKAGDEAVITKYKAMYRYWHDSISYSKLDIRKPKCESLCETANDLLGILEDRINSHSLAYEHRRTGSSSKNLQTILTLEKK